MKIGRRELDGRLGCDRPRLAVNSAVRTNGQAYETVSATLLCWGTAALAGLSLYCFLKWREQTPAVGPETTRRAMARRYWHVQPVAAAGFSIWPVTKFTSRGGLLQN